MAPRTRHTPRSHAAALAIAISVVTSSSPAWASHPAPPKSVPTAKAGARVERGFTEVTLGALPAKKQGSVYVSGAPSPSDVGAMKAAGVVAIIDVRQPSEDRDALVKAAAAAGLAYHNVPLFKDVGVIDPMGVDAISALHAKYGDAPHVVSCKSGNRSSAWWAADQVGAGRRPVEASIGEAKGAFLRDDMAEAVRAWAKDFAARK